VNRYRSDSDLPVEAFRYSLPESLIAQEPAPSRQCSRLMVLDRKRDGVEHRLFEDIPTYLHPGDVLILNDARVIPARFYAQRESGGRVEVFVLDGWENSPQHRVLLKPARRIRRGESLLLEDGMTVRVVERGDREFVVEMDSPEAWTRYLNDHGVMPLPPYIRRSVADGRDVLDRERYQTVFADRPGAVAAPTAGLHFTRDLLETLEQRGIEVIRLTLWVGWGTFKPVTCEWVSEHVMDTEIYAISETAAAAVRRARKDGRRIIAVGTTTTRALESWAVSHPELEPVFRGEASIFITPGYRFRIINAMITNFHLPGSSLMMLVSALAGRERILRAYETAVAHQYRFYSYGDAMFIF